MQKSKLFVLFFVTVYFVCERQTNQMSAGNPSKNMRAAQPIDTAYPEQDYDSGENQSVYRTHSSINGLVNLVVVGNCSYANGCLHCPFGSSLTVECSIGNQESDSTLANAALLRLLHNGSTVAEGSANETLRYTLRAKGAADELYCQALAANLVELDYDDRVICYGLPRLPDTDCEILLFIDGSTSSQRSDVRCSIAPTDDEIARETHLEFNSSISLWFTADLDHPCNTSRSFPNSECPRQDYTRGVCEWSDVLLQLSSVCLHVSGTSSLRRWSELRPVKLQDHLRLGNPLSIPSASVVSSSSWLNRTLLVQWSQPPIADGPLAFPLRELGIPLAFQFTIRLRCLRSIFPDFFACRRFHELNSSVSNMLEVKFELPAGGVYRLELVARIPPNARFSPPAVLAEVEVNPTAFFWAVFIVVLLLVIVMTIAITGIIVCYIRHKMSLMLPCETPRELLPHNPPGNTSSGYVASQLFDQYESIQNHSVLRSAEFYDETQTTSLEEVDYVEPGLEHQAPAEHINQKLGYAVDIEES